MIKGLKRALTLRKARSHKYIKKEGKRYFYKEASNKRLSAAKTIVQDYKRENKGNYSAPTVSESLRYIKEKEKKKSGVSKIDKEVASIIKSPGFGKEERATIQSAIKEGWKPKSYKEYKRIAIENEKEHVADDDEQLRQTYIDTLMSRFKKMPKKEKIEAYGEGAERYDEDDALEMFSDWADDSDIDELVDTLYGGWDKYPIEDSLALTIYLDADAFVEDKKEEVKEQEWHKKNPHAKGLTEHLASKGLSGISKEHIDAISEYISKKGK